MVFRNLRNKTIKITNYASLLSVAAQQTEPQRLLFVFLEVSLPDNPQADEATQFHARQGGELQPIMCVDKALIELGSFLELVEESKQLAHNWQIVLAAGISGKNGITPTSDEAESPLKMMVKTVQMGGSLSNYIALDRAGEVVHFS